MRVSSLLPLVGALLVLNACDDDDPSGPSNQAQLRFVHAAPETEAVTLRIDGVSRRTNVAFGNTSAPYLNVAPGEREIAVRLSNGTTDLATLESDLDANVAYTAIFGKDGEEESIVVLTDDIGAPAAGKAELRLVHAAPSQDDLDVYITAPDADLEEETADASAISYEEASANLALDAGTYRVRFTTAGTKTVVLNIHPVTVVAGQIRTIIALDDEEGGAPLTSVSLADRN